MSLDLRRDKKDFEVNEVDPISKACQDYLKSEEEINNLELMIKAKKESLRQQNELIVQLMEERGVTSIRMKDGQSVDRSSADIFWRFCRAQNKHKER